MLEVKNLDITINERFLVKDLTFTLQQNDKLAVIGEEGNGKSTLLKVLAGKGDYATISGSINYHRHTVGYLPQSIDSSDNNKSVFDYLFIDTHDYYNKVNDLYKHLNSLCIDENILNQNITTLSGGEKVKIGILKLLLKDYDILLLDEPTNDLDIETLKWLEELIRTINKPLMYVSHDETLLANTANAILHLEQIQKKTACRYTLSKTDYDTYINKRLKAIDRQIQISQSEKRDFKKKQAKLNQIMQKVEYQQNTISRGDPHTAAVLKKKMHSLKSQERKMNNAELTSMPDLEERINFSFEQAVIPKNKIIIDLDIPELKVGDKLLAKNIKLNIKGKQHLCIIGKNGVGKSTLIKLIYENLKDRTDILVGYMPQNYNDIFEKYVYVADFICPNKNKDDLTKAKTYLGNMKFTREEMNGQIKDLSNGTKAKLFLIKFVLNKYNVLILDEPTRNVSPLSNPVIRKALADYTGTIISVSHDRKYIAEVIDSLYVLNENGLKKEM
ncbi:MAG: ATP-binding cassette domain-containing protein [Erysipelotrichia bacterium]|nr:ATP-binding cassette domain-containing protein [Erysipelotrichia bacterium]